MPGLDEDGAADANTIGISTCDCGHVHLVLVDVHGDRISAALDLGEALRIAHELTRAALRVKLAQTPAAVLQ